MPKPPLQITLEILNLHSRITALLARLEGTSIPRAQPQLRRKNKVRTVQGSLAIEGNTLDLEQVTAILEGKRVVGPTEDIIEVQNALAAYERAGEFNPFSEKDFRKAHATMMAGRFKDAGRWRSTNVGIVKGARVAHVAPKPALVPALMRDLFSFLAKDKDIPGLVRACVFHYEVEFIHPFTDGNGRMGRFWQHVMAVHEHPVFALVPVESLIKTQQTKYYQVLATCDRAGDCTAFVEFSLGVLAEELDSVLRELKPGRLTAGDRLTTAIAQFKGRKFSRKDYGGLFPAISTATASRDLAFGVKRGLLRRIGDKAKALYSVPEA